MAHGQQRERQVEIETGHRAAIAAKAEEVHDVAGEQTSRNDQGERRSTDRAPHHGEQAGAVLIVRGLGPVAAAADFQHFGARHALGIRQVGLGHQGPPQRDRIHHAEHATQGADGERLPVGKARPPADHDQPGQYENDRR